jgi:hypothetical protein
MSGLALESLSHSYIIHIRSKDVRQLTDGFNTDLQISLDAEIKRRNLNQDIHISLSSAEIPLTYYQFSSNLDNLNLYVDGAPSLVLLEGNYDIYELTDAITADVTFPFTATYNQNTGKVTLTNTTGGSLTINFSQVNSRGLAKALGFERSDELVAGAASTSSDGVVNLQTVHTIFLYTDLGASNVITTEKGNYEAILDKIPVLARPFEIIHYDPYQTAPFTTVLTNDVISNFRLALRDQNGKLIQMNDVRFELSLLVEVHDNKQEPPVIVQPQGRRTLAGEMRNEMAALVETAPSQQSGITAGPIIPVQSLFTPTPTPTLTSTSTFVPALPKPVVPVPAVPMPVIEPPLSKEQINADAELTDALLMAIQLDLE